MSEMICIVCPIGCQLSIERNQKEILVSGNQCPRGKAYALKELVNPSRTLTTTIKIHSVDAKLLSVKTNQEIPKLMMMECMKILKKIQTNVPVECGDVILHDIANTGVDIVATQTIKK